MILGLTVSTRSVGTDGTARIVADVTGDLAAYGQLSVELTPEGALTVLWTAAAGKSLADFRAWQMGG